MRRESGNEEGQGFSTRSLGLGLGGRGVAETLRLAARDIARMWQAAGPAVALAYLRTAARQAPNILARQSLLPVDEAMPRTVYRFSPFKGGPQIIIDTADGRPGSVFAGAREIYCRRVYFTIPDFRIKPGDLVVDLGANMGLFTTLSAALGAQVLSLEAQDGFLPLLYRNLDRNRVSERVTVRHGLIGGTVGRLAPSGRVRQASHWFNDPPPVTMDELLDEAGFQVIDFLKVDIEGSEFALFREAASWLRKVRRLVMEVHSTYGDPGSLTDILDSEGFSVQLVNNSARIVTSTSDTTFFIFAWRLA